MRFKLGDRVQIKKPQDIIDSKDFPTEMRVASQTNPYKVYTIDGISHDDDDMYHVKEFPDLDGFYGYEIKLFTTEWDN